MPVRRCVISPRASMDLGLPPADPQGYLRERSAAMLGELAIAKPVDTHGDSTSLELRKWSGGTLLDYKGRMIPQDVSARVIQYERDPFSRRAESMLVIGTTNNVNRFFDRFASRGSL